ncbi:MAG: pimeloyl-ACP methyl ester esterase BioH [Perlucidibaca sp.]
MSALMLYHDTYACTGPAGADAPALVLLHGWGLHSVVWDPVVPALLEQFQVTVIDLPGLGRSPMPGGDYDLDYLLAHVLRVAPPSALWVAWSLGGEVATAIAARHPERVRALVLVASNPCFVQRPDWPAAMPASVFGQFRDLFEEDRDGTLIRFLSLQCRGSERMKEDIRFLQEIMYLQGLPAPRALREGLRLLGELDLRADFAGLAQPVQAILGASDYLVPAVLGDALKQLRPALDLAVISGSGHAPFLAQPELFLQALRDFVHDHALA